MNVLIKTILILSLTFGVISEETKVDYHKTPSNANVVLRSGDPTAVVITVALFPYTALINRELPEMATPVKSITYNRATNEVVLLRNFKLSQLTVDRSGKYIVAARASNSYGINSSWTWKAIELIGPPSKVDLTITFETSSGGITLTNVLETPRQETRRFPAPVE